MSAPLKNLGWNALGAYGTPKAVRVACAAALPAYTQAGAGVGATLTMDAVGVVTVDGLAIVLDDRIFLPATLAAAADDAGIYKCTTEGTAGVAAVFTRATDFDAAAAGEIELGAMIRPTAGTANAGKTYILTTATAITVDTTALAFSTTAAGSESASTIYTTPLSLWPNTSGLSAIVTFTETVANFTGSLSVEIVNATPDEIKRSVAGTLTLPWKTWETIDDLTGTLTISAGVIAVSMTSGTMEFPMQLSNIYFGWLRFKFVGTIGAGTVTMRVTTKDGF